MDAATRHDPLGGRRRPPDDLLRGLIFDPATFADPYPHYAALRRRGRMVAGPLALNTAHHDITVAVLRSPDLGVVAGPGGRAPAVLRTLSRLGGTGPLSAVNRLPCWPSTRPSTPATASS